MHVSHQKTQSGLAGFRKNKANGSSRDEGPPIRSPVGFPCHVSICPPPKGGDKLQAVTK